MKSLSLADISMMSVVATRGRRGRVLEGRFNSTFQLSLSDQVVFRSGSGMQQLWSQEFCATSYTMPERAWLASGPTGDERGGAVGE